MMAVIQKLSSIIELQSFSLFLQKEYIHDQNHRIERDSLWRSLCLHKCLYGAQTQRAIENFPISGLKPHQAFIWSMGMIKRAAAEVNRDLGMLAAEKANVIMRAAQEVIDGQWNEQFVVDPFQAGAGTRSRNIVK
jgi:fumarate hydratase class II